MMAEDPVLYGATVRLERHEDDGFAYVIYDGEVYGVVNLEELMDIVGGE